MKLKLTIFLLVSIFATSYAQQTNSQTKYENGESRFTLNFPAGWNISENDEGQLLAFALEGGKDIRLSSSKIVELSTIVDKEALKQFNEIFITELKSRIKSSKAKLKSKETTLSHPTYNITKVTCTVTYGKETAYMYVYEIVIGNRIYPFMAGTTKAYAKKYEPVFDQIIKSVEIQ